MFNNEGQDLDLFSSTQKYYIRVKHPNKHVELNVQKLSFFLITVECVLFLCDNIIN